MSADAPDRDPPSGDTGHGVAWAATLGHAVFGRLPDSPTVAAALVDGAGGLHVPHRERARARDDTRRRMG